MRWIAFAALLPVLMASCGGETVRPPANFPEAIAIAPLDEALTFARFERDGAMQLLAVAEYDGDRVSAFNLTEALGAKFDDPVTAFNDLGYDALRDRIEAGFAEARVDVPVSDLVLPLTLNDAHIAAGTNFAAHAEESSVEDGPFLFAKLVTPTPFNATVHAGDALLDYEVEVAFVTLTDTSLPDAPEFMGLMLANDFTDRATLVRLVNPSDVTSGDGFATGKGGEGYLPVGNLFVIPRDFESFADGIELQLAVNGELRQQASMTLAIWDIHELLVQTEARKDKRWTHLDAEVGLPVNDGVVPARTMILAGTPDGTVFKGIARGTMVAGALRWVAGGWGKPITDHVVERYIKTENEDGRYLQPGDEVHIHVDRLGEIETTVE